MDRLDRWRLFEGMRSCKSKRAGDTGGRTVAVSEMREQRMEREHEAGLRWLGAQKTGTDGTFSES